MVRRLLAVLRGRGEALCGGRLEEGVTFLRRQDPDPLLLLLALKLCPTVPPPPARATERGRVAEVRS
jgi:hypothetical protein